MVGGAGTEVEVINRHPQARDNTIDSWGKGIGPSPFDKRIVIER